MILTESKHTNRAVLNRATLIITAAMGIVFGISGFGHGFFEALQGNIPTGGFYINAIGDNHLFWPQGHEPAVTLIPNFRITGIAAMAVSLMLITWSAGFLSGKKGPLIYALLFTVLLLTGGGVAQVVFFPLFWALAFRIHKPLNRWEKRLPPSILSVLKRLWAPLLGLSAFLILYTLQIAVFGYVPGVKDPDTIGLVMVLTLGAGVIFLIPAILGGFAYDIEKNAASGALLESPHTGPKSRNMQY